MRAGGGSGAAAALLVVVGMSAPTCLDADEAGVEQHDDVAPPTWSADEFALCPSDCGQPVSTLERSVRCARLDGTQQRQQVCGLETKPETRRVCPATEACRVYAWKAQPFDECPDTCGHAPILQRRNVPCVYYDHQGLEVSANENPACDMAAQPASVRACPATAACSSYGWHTRPFEPCNEECGHGAVLQTRFVQCETSDGTTVDDNLCEHEARPADSTQCPATGACAAHEWRAPAFPACATDCGRSGYTDTRQMHCVELEPSSTLADARIVDDVHCASTLRPADSRECPATDACLSYTWQAEPFTECPQDCGFAAFIQVRAVTCTTMARAVDASHCERGSDPPLSVRTCPATAPCIDYSWGVPEDFERCPEGCGQDVTIQSREIFCIAMAGTAEAEVVQSSRCDADEKPQSERTCQATEECVVWSWAAEEWPPCPTECGQEPTLQQRMVMCEGSDGTVFAADTGEAERHCSDAHPPAVRRACNRTPPCITYDWVVENPGTPFPPLCPTSCGLNTSVFVRKVYCGGSDRSVVDDGNCSSTDGATEKPVSRHACPATEPCVTFAWVVDPPSFPACKTTCGQAEVVNTRLVTCAGSDGSVGSVTDCYGDPPESRQVCSRTPDCVQFDWEALPVDFPPCPTACGYNASVQHRNVTCRGSDGSLLSGTAATAACDAEKPAEARSCPATSPCVTYSWQAQSFLPCSTECGQDATLQSRAVLCVGTDGSETVGDAAAAKCLQAGPGPPARHACMPTDACVHWRWRAQPSTFPSCPTECGQNTSSLTRRVICEGTDGTILDAGDPEQRELAQVSDRCGDTAVPQTRYACPETQPCMKFHWMAPSFPESCPDPALCGQRERVTTRSVECRGDDGSIYEDARCLATRVSAPPSRQVCPGTAACVVYSWVATPAEFSPCPTTCGMAESTQTRDVECHGSDGSVLTGREAGFSCTARPPSSHKHCQSTAGCVAHNDQDWQPFSWQAADFPPCSTSCGAPAIIQRRHVVCMAGAEGREDGQGTHSEVDPGQCIEAGRQPEALRACPATEPCQITPPPSLPEASQHNPAADTSSTIPDQDPTPPLPEIPQHNPAPVSSSSIPDQGFARVEGGYGSSTFWLGAAVLCLVCVVPFGAAFSARDSEGIVNSVPRFARFRSSVSGGHLTDLSPTRQKTTWSDLPRDSFGAQAGVERERLRVRSQSNSPSSAVPKDNSEACICTVGRASVEVDTRMSTTIPVDTMSNIAEPVSSRWTTSALPAAVRRRSLSPPRRRTLSGERSRSPSRTLRVDNTMRSHPSRSPVPRRLVELETFSETSDSELDTDEESQRLRAQLGRQPDHQRRTGGAAGGRWDRDNAHSALGKVVEQNQPAFLYSL